MTWFYVDSTHLFITLCGVVVLMRIVHGNRVSEDVCIKWRYISQKESEKGRAQNCSIRPYECALLDCYGTHTFLQKEFAAFTNKDFTMYFCFGLLVNYCNSPLSMDFYAQVPTKRSAKTLKITEDDFKFEWKELYQPMASLGIAFPVLTFKFKRNANSTLHFSIHVGVNVETRYGVFTIPNFGTYLISDHIVPLKVCDRIIKDDNTLPPDYFVPVMCKIKDYKRQTTVAPVNSGTVNKNCDMNHTFCGYGEMCDLSLEEPKCVCSSRFQLNARNDACDSVCKLNQPCGHDDDCGVNEECKTNALNKGMFCQCRKDYEYSKILDMCADPPPRDYTVLKAIGWILAAAICFGVIICCIMYCYHLRSQQLLSDYRN